MKNSKDLDDYPEIRSFPLYIILICGLLISLAGLLLVISKTILQGKTFPGRVGQGGGTSFFLNGWGILIVGLGFCIFPVYYLVKNYLQKKRKAGLHS